MSQKDSLSKLKNFFRMDKNSSGEFNGTEMCANDTKQLNKQI